MVCLYVFFFFQAEDGIRDYKVTGVQTCALPISLSFSAPRLVMGMVAIEKSPCSANAARCAVSLVQAGRRLCGWTCTPKANRRTLPRGGFKNGRKSGRGRGEDSGGAGSFKKKNKE